MTVASSGAAALRIGVVLHDFALGGTERIAVRLAAAWAERGACVTIFCGSADGPLATLAGDGVAIPTASPPIARARGSRRRLGRAAAAYWADRPVDILFVPGNYHWGVIPAIAGLPGDIRPAIVAQVSASLDKPQRGLLRQWGFDLRMRRLLRGADAIVALFDRASDDADRIAGGMRARTIALPALSDDAPPPQGAARGRAIVAAGRLVREKGFADLIDAFALLADPAARLVIVGAGPERDHLLARAAMLGISEQMSLPGYVTDIRPWLDEARLFVLSSHYEGYPAVLVEALNAGRPVVATRCTSAVDALIDGPETGSVVPIRHPWALARAIAAQMDRPPPDPDALALRVAHHRIGSVAADYIDLFEQVAAQRARAA